MFRRGFTLIELLVVISIISMLASVTLTSLSAARDKARIAASRQFDANIYHTTGDRLLGQWDMNECNNIAVNDSSGLGNNGIMISAASWSTNTPTNEGCSVNFDGTSQYIEISQGLGTNMNLSASGELTLTAWVYMADTAVPHTLAGTGNPYNIGGNGLTLSYGYPNPSFFSGHLNAGSGAGVTLNFLPNAPMSINKWHHVAFSFTSTLASFYMDGKLMGTTDITGVGISGLGNFPFRIGAYANAPTVIMWKGMIDNARVYKGALTASEIGRIYAEGAIKHSLAEN